MYASRAHWGPRGSHSETVLTYQYSMDYREREEDTAEGVLVPRPSGGAERQVLTWDEQLTSDLFPNLCLFYPLNVKPCKCIIYFKTK